MRNTSAFARFPPRLQEAIASRLGWSSLRPVQEMAGQALLDGKNAIILAPTAGGKTEASFFPLLATLMEREPQGVSATVGNPADILKWLQGTSKREACVVNPLKTPSPKDLRICLRENLGAIANDASKTAQGKKSL